MSKSTWYTLVGLIGFCVLGTISFGLAAAVDLLSLKGVLAVWLAIASFFTGGAAVLHLIGAFMAANDESKKEEAKK